MTTTKKRTAAASATLRYFREITSPRSAGELAECEGIWVVMSQSGVIEGVEYSKNIRQTMVARHRAQLLHAPKRFYVMGLSHDSYFVHAELKSEIPEFAKNGTYWGTSIADIDAACGRAIANVNAQTVARERAFRKRVCDAVTEAIRNGEMSLPDLRRAPKRRHRLRT